MTCESRWVLCSDRLPAETEYVLLHAPSLVDIECEYAIARWHAQGNAGKGFWCFMCYPEGLLRTQSEDEINAMYTMWSAIPTLPVGGSKAEMAVEDGENR